MEKLKNGLISDYPKHESCLKIIDYGRVQLVSELDCYNTTYFRCCHKKIAHVTPPINDVLFYNEHEFNINSKLGNLLIFKRIDINDINEYYFSYDW